MIRTILFILSLVLISPVWAGFGGDQTKGNAGAPGEWLTTYGASARAVAMGGAGTALQGSDMSYMNPAGIVGVEAAEATILATPLLSDGQFQALSISYPFENRTRGLGLSIYHLASGEAEQTNALGETTGSFKEDNVAALFTLGRTFWRDWLSVGANLKYIRQTLAGGGDAGFGLDAGFQARPFGEKFYFGAGMTNIIAPSLTLSEEEESYSRSARVGAASQWRFSKASFLVSADLYKTEDVGGNGITRTAFGLEANPYIDLALPVFFRAGLNHRGLSLGLGIMEKPVSLEYAATFHELEMTHQFGVKFKFGLLNPMAEAKLQDEWTSLAKREERMKKALNEKEYTIRRLKQELKKGQLPLREEKPKTVSNNRQEMIQNISKTAYQQALLFYKEKNYRKAKDALLEDRNPGARMSDKELSLERLIEGRLLIQKEKYEEARAQLFTAVEYDPLNVEAAEVYRKVSEIIQMNAELETLK